MSHLAESSAELVTRVRRIAGQVGAIERALQGEAGCTEVLHLVAAVRGAVNGLLDEIIAEHLQEHVARADLSEEERSKGAAELLAVIRRYAK
jgi:DNA-binding FrmR family transcriptional regulator